MSDDRTKPEGQLPPTLAQQVGSKADRKLRAQGSDAHVWFGLGMMGLIGWAERGPQGLRQEGQRRAVPLSGQGRRRQLR